jgi:iron complex transport system ATP-binding protein
MTVLEARAISHGYGQSLLLDEVSLALSPGQSLAIIGPNGVGKTTLLRILSGLLTPRSGEVLLDGRPLSDLSRRAIATAIAVVPQARPQVFDFSALELVLMGFHARSKRFSLPSRTDMTLAMAAMEELAIAELANRPASVLSGGELQRVLMARAMVSAAPIWLLDEPTASLDLKHQIALLDQLGKHGDKGGSAIAILHDLALVHRFFDHVLVLSAGKVIAQGPPNQILTETVVSQAFGTPMVRGEVDGRIVWVGA